MQLEKIGGRPLIARSRGFRQMMNRSRLYHNRFSAYVEYDRKRQLALEVENRYQVTPFKPGAGRVSPGGRVTWTLAEKVALLSRQAKASVAGFFRGNF